MAHTLPADYLERTYAGVLGKLIGVFLGRPIEGWSYQRIVEELGPIEYYVNERLNQPLVVTDDDVGGTFTFVRALEDYGISPDLTSDSIGKAWLNYLIEHRTILWWGGNGMSTEHTVWLNLKRGVPAPASGSIETNGATIAEQIGAQIFIDGWAMVAPGQPKLAAKLARAAGSVSHDGEAVHAAMLWAAMEAEAFVSADIEHLIDVGLSVVPRDCLVGKLIADIRRWHAKHSDWRDTRAEIEVHFGYDQFPGNCHVIPNHALMIMAVLYASDDFSRAQMIVNTSGWDTDCNAGNVGCLMGLMLGLDGLATGPDWRGPIADRMLMSSADGGNSISDAVRVSCQLVNLGRQLAGQGNAAAPKSGARFHFSLPGSVQGFRPQTSVAQVENLGGGLAISFNQLAKGQTAAATTPVFAPQDVASMRTYELMATPLLNPGQVMKARVIAPRENTDAVNVSLRLRVFGGDDRLHDRDGDAVWLKPGEERVLALTVPDLGSQPVGEVGIAIAGGNELVTGAVILDYLRWDGAPEVRLARPKDGGEFWRRAWVNGVSSFWLWPKAFRINQSGGEGLLAYGTREWNDYAVASDLAVNLGDGGIAVRVQGMRRYYAIRMLRRGALQIVRVRDNEQLVLAECPFAFAMDKVVSVRATVRGSSVSVTADGVTLTANDDSAERLADGGIGLIVANGMLECDAVTVSDSSGP
jgi:ADP-ribosylglycohydrolase